MVPLPKIDEMYAKFVGLRIYSTLDLRSDYYHIALFGDSWGKSAFVTPRESLNSKSSFWARSNSCLFPATN